MREKIFEKNISSTVEHFTLCLLDLLSRCLEKEQHILPNGGFKWYKANKHLKQIQALNTCFDKRSPLRPLQKVRASICPCSINLSYLYIHDTVHPKNRTTTCWNRTNNTTALCITCVVTILARRPLWGWDVRPGSSGWEFFCWSQVPMKREHGSMVMYP